VNGITLLRKDEEWFYGIKLALIKKILLMFLLLSQLVTASTRICGKIRLDSYTVGRPH
jgi:hypothetical protein